MSKTPIPRVNVDMPPDLLADLWQSLIRQNMTMKSWAEAAARKTLAEERLAASSAGPVVPLRAESSIQTGKKRANQFERWHAMLDDILDSGIPEYVHAIIANLEGWSRAAKGTRTDEPTRGTTALGAGDQTGTIEELDRATKRAQEGEKGNPENKPRSA